MFRTQTAARLVGCVALALFCLGVSALSVHAQAPRATLGWYDLATISSTSTVNAATFVDSQTGWAVGTDGGLFVTHDGGQTWSTFTTGIPDDLNWISFADSQNGYAAGDSILLHTSDGGATWQQRRLPTTMDHLSSLSAPAGGPLFVVAQPDSAPDGVYESTDYGVTWHNVFTGTVSTVLFVTATNGYAIGQGGVYHTTDGGNTWQTVFNDGPYDAISFVSPSVGYVVAGDGSGGTVDRLERTTDGGASWTQVAAPATGACYSGQPCQLSLAFVSPTQGLFGYAGAGSDSWDEIQATSDGGTSWQSQLSGEGLGASVVGYRGSTPYAIIDSDDGDPSGYSGSSDFYYYGFPIPAPTDTPTATDVPSPTDMPTATPIPPAATATPVPPGATPLPSRPPAQQPAPSAPTNTQPPSVSPSDTPAPPDAAPPAPTAEASLTEASRPIHCHALTLQSVVSCVEGSILRIDVHLQDSDVQGTGFVVRADRSGTYVLTNRHVVEGGTPASVRVIAPDGRTSYRVMAVSLNTAKSGTAGDLAIIKLAPAGLRPLAFGDSTHLRPGQSVASIGYGLAFQLGGPPSVTEGIVSAVGRDLGDGFGPVWIQHQSTINPGNSGGPLLDMSGDVVGVNTLSIDQLQGDGDTTAVQGVFFAIPSTLAEPIVSRLIAGIGHVSPEQLRAANAVARVLASGYSVAVPCGWLVNRVHPTQPSVLSRDQLVQVLLASHGQRGRLTVHELEAYARKQAQRFGKPLRLTVARLATGKLRGISVAATFAKRPYQVTVVAFPAGGNHAIPTLVAVVRRGATRQDRQQYRQLVASVQVSAPHR